MNGSVTPAPAIPMCDLHPSRFAESCPDCAAIEYRAQRQRETELRVARNEVARQLYSESMIELALKGMLMRSCLNCDNFKNDLCNHPSISVPTQPPPRVIVFGCDGHSDEIPF